MGGLSGETRVCSLSTPQCPVRMMQILGSGGDDPLKSGLRKGREPLRADAEAGKEQIRLETHFLSARQPGNT